jgi:hypothetical protein
MFVLAALARVAIGVVVGLVAAFALTLPDVVADAEDGMIDGQFRSMPGR